MSKVTVTFRDGTVEEFPNAVWERITREGLEGVEPTIVEIASLEVGSKTNARWTVKKESLIYSADVIESVSQEDT